MKAKDLTHLSPDYKAFQRGEAMPPGMRNCCNAMADAIEAMLGVLSLVAIDDDGVTHTIRLASDAAHSWRALTRGDES